MSETANEAVSEACIDAIKDLTVTVPFEVGMICVTHFDFRHKMVCFRFVVPFVCLVFILSLDLK